MAKRVKLKNDMYLDTKYSVHNDTILYDYLNGLNNKLSGIKITTIKEWKETVFAARTVVVNTTKYDFMILFYKSYVAISAVQSKILYTGIDTQLDDIFWYNNLYYYGNRDVFVTSSNIRFGNAYNDIKKVDNSWYMPIKLIGINLGGGVIKYFKNLIANLIGGGKYYAYSS